MLGSFLDDFGMTLGQFWDHFGDILGSLWDRGWGKLAGEGAGGTRLAEGHSPTLYVE